MANYLCRAMYRNSDFGWSENYFLDALSPADALPLFQDLMNLRMPMMANDCFLDGMSLIDIARPKSSYPVAYPTSRQGTYSIPPSFNLNVCILLKQFVLSTDPDAGRFSTRPIRAVPEDSITSPDTYTPSTAFTTALSAYIAELVAHWSIALKNPAPPPRWILKTMQLATIDHLSKRATGRPFFQPRGRRTAPLL